MAIFCLQLSFLTFVYQITDFDLKLRRRFRLRSKLQTAVSTLRCSPLIVWCNTASVALDFTLLLILF